MARSHTENMAHARNAIKLAQDVRAYHRKRTKPGHPQRASDVGNALHALRKAMTPIRAALGRAPYDPISDQTRKRHAELHEVSHSIQVERRKLWKLRGGKGYLNVNRNYKRKHGTLNE